MRKNNAIALMSHIREKANRLLVQELKHRGLCGIVPSHGEIMIRLFGGQSYSMKDLAAQIHRTQPTVTVLVNKLEAHGYLHKEKSSTDSRVTCVRLSEKGRALQPVFAEISAKLNALVYGGMSEAEAAALEEVLAAIDQRLAGPAETK